MRGSGGGLLIRRSRRIPRIKRYGIARPLVIFASVANNLRKIGAAAQIILR